MGVVNLNHTSYLFNDVHRDEPLSKRVRASRISTAIDSRVTIDTVTPYNNCLHISQDRLVIVDIMAITMAGSASHIAERPCIHNEVCQNYLRQFREENACRFHRFTATQFMDVWNHYDTDGR